mgnify:FL=1
MKAFEKFIVDTVCYHLDANTSDTVQEILYLFSDPYLQYYMDETPLPMLAEYAPSDVLEALTILNMVKNAVSTDTELRLIAANKSMTPKSILRILSKDKNAKVRRAVRNNPNAPRSLRRM